MKNHRTMTIQDAIKRYRRVSYAYLLASSVRNTMLKIKTELTMMKARMNVKLTPTSTLLRSVVSRYYFDILLLSLLFLIW
jgi:hypothetical protein